jgi:hypothetical protein
MSVDLPSSTDPEVLKRRISMGCWVWGIFGDGRWEFGDRV